MIEKKMYIKTIHAKTITFEEGYNKATIKVESGEVMDKAIELLGKYCTIEIIGGYVTRIRDSEEIWREEYQQ